MRKPARSKGVSEYSKTPLLRAGFCKQGFRNAMDIDAFILIGGRSSRFGSDKAFAEFGGKTLVERAVETVESALSPEKVRFVAGSESQFAAELIFKLGRPVVTDLNPGFGAWSGLHTALAYSSSEWTFVLACDLPFVSAGLIRKLAGWTVEDVDAIVPLQPDDRLQPLCAFYRRETVLPEIERRISATGPLPRVAAIFDAVITRIVSEEEYADLPGSERFFKNVNFTHDLPLEIWSM